MVLSSIVQKKSYPALQQVQVFDDTRIGARCVVKADNGKPVIGAVRELKTKRVWANGTWQPQEWARIEIPGVGKRWIPPTYFIAWCWL